MPQQPWLSFAMLVLVQLALFILVARLRKLPLKPALAVLPAAMALGLLFGLLFDLLVGEGGAIFHYRIAGSWPFLLLNGVFSYGLALATAALFPRVLLPSPRGARWYRRAAAPALLWIAAALAAVFLPAGPLQRMLAAGLVVVAAGETIAALSGRMGPLSAMASGNVRAFGSLWAASAAIGLAYETANYAFPVWRWALLDTLPAWLVELFVVAFGYVVLFHPLAIAWQLLQQKLGGPLPQEFVQRQ